MKCVLNYKEVSEYVAAHYGKQVELRRIDSKTVGVKVAQKVILATIKIPMEITVENVEDSRLEIFYSGNAGVELIIKGALLVIREKLPQLASMIIESNGNHLTIDLEKVDMAKALVENVRLMGVEFEESDIVVSASLK